MQIQKKSEFLFTFTAIIYHFLIDLLIKSVSFCKMTLIMAIHLSLIAMSRKIGISCHLHCNYIDIISFLIYWSNTFHFAKWLIVTNHSHLSRLQTSKKSECLVTYVFQVNEINACQFPCFQWWVKICIKHSEFDAMQFCLFNCLNVPISFGRVLKWLFCNL